MSKNLLELETILQNWEKDSQLNPMKLDEETIKTAKLHAKYLKQLTLAKLLLKKAESNFDILLKDKWLYYNGKMSKDEIMDRDWDFDIFKGLSKPLKSDMDYYYKSDNHIITAKEKIEYLKTVKDTLEEIINNIRWRHQTIKNIIEWKKFEAGM